jgi:hypothetical protein
MAFANTTLTLRNIVGYEMGNDGQLGDLVLWSVYSQRVPHWRYTNLVLEGQAEVGQLGFWPEPNRAADASQGQWVASLQHAPLALVPARTRAPYSPTRPDNSASTSTNYYERAKAGQEDDGRGDASGNGAGKTIKDDRTADEVMGPPLKRSKIDEGLKEELGGRAV